MPPLQTESDEPASEFDVLLRIDEREFDNTDDEAVADLNLPIPAEGSDNPRLTVDNAIDKLPEELKEVLAERLVASFREVITYRPQIPVGGSGATSRPSQ